MKIVVFGAKGRLGSKVCEIARTRGHVVIGVEKGQKCEEKADVCINFSLASATADVCEYCEKHGVTLVDGVTGRSANELKMMQDLAQKVTVIHKDNFAMGVTVLKDVSAFLAQKMHECDVEIVEMHHRDKKDSPSGTAKMLATEITKNRPFSKVAIHSLRLGDTVGTHTVIFAGNGESIEITHRATDVNTFALGAVKEAEKHTNE